MRFEPTLFALTGAVSMNSLSALFCLIGGSLFLTIDGSAQSRDQQNNQSLSASEAASRPDSTPDLDKAARRIVERTNTFRSDQDREPLNPDPALEQTAQYFADFMARTDEYGHTADGSRPSERAASRGYEYCVVSENIAYQYNSLGFTTGELVEGFVEGWKDSPGHRKNMLDPAVTETGVAIAHSDTTGHYYAVQMFGLPKSAMTEFSLQNRTESVIQYTVAEQSFSLPPRYRRTHQQCQQVELTVKWPDDQAATELEPEAGQLWVITRTSGEFQISTD